MSNPKVFEFAKEIGMTPLALMDKIREWQIPVKSHMAELSPEVLAQIKVKLGGGEAAAEEVKPKKTATRKPAAKKATAAAAEPETPAAASKSPVIRRKKDEVPVEPPKAKVISKPEAEAPVATEEEASKTTRVVVKKPTVAKEAPAPAEEAPVAAAKPVVEEKVTKVEAPPAPVAEVKAEPVAAPAPEAAAPAVARKKEVVVGTSGVASASTPASAPKRNIIGRMDLSRVQSQAPPRSGGYQGGDRGERPQGDRQGGGFGGGPRPGGFNRPAGGAPTRNIRTGFVAQAPMAPPEPLADADRSRDFDKRKRFGSGPSAGAGPAGPGAAGAGGTGREEAPAVFNAVEFRKREMVFQPKKKKGLLDRESMKTQITTPSAHKRVVKVNGSMKVSDLAVEMGLKAPQLIKVLMQNGVMGNMNTVLDFDTIALIVPEFGWEAQNIFKTADEVLEATAFGNLEAERITRPPVVTVMGHVDHGKTSLLDAIRNAKVAAGEAGGITQHIGAYSVKMDDGSFITFLDTPGHEAFTAMRARGANATDIAIIVVAADDGMMPQTQEAINHAKAAGVPIIVAVNKIDKPGANPDKIKQQLTELEIVPEEWGGSTIFVEVSALKRTGIDTLLENIRLVAEVQDLKANPERSGTGIVIEAKVEKGKGSVATILVKDGSVSVGQYIVAGTVKGRIRSLMNDRGERVQSVGPGFPVEVQGLESTPAAGDKFDIVKDESTAEKAAALRKEQAEAAAATPASKMSLDEIFSKVKSGDVKELGIILKADVHGSLEAINGMLSKLSTSEVKARVIHSAVGGINESDVLLAHTAKGIVLGFNVRPDSGAQAKAKQMGVDIRTYSIVYELIDEMKKAMAGLLSPDVVEEQMGRAEVRNTFTVPKVGTIAGCFVTEGKVQRNNMIRLIRDGKIVYEGKISSLKRFKDDAKEVASGYECGIGIENFNDVKNGDIMEAYVKKEIARELDGSASV
ncbi:translation initiation factor IF-2 [Bdellovibrio sp. HCB2-146]|uniref:translation initiation factor IF-2 n=1 Tax=Bdellovibrio sp. HCB2-146 TaxID=3394362 RepID=UPI0039BCA839